MSCSVPRTCTEVRQPDGEQGGEVRSRPLAAFREASAYVVLGDPGSGKSTSFFAESAALGGEAYLESARDFLILDRESERRGKTLFIDGLDEVRAGRGDVRTPLDELRRRLDALGRPRFRLSCREADWLGTNDRSHLAKVSSDAALTVLSLDPLSDENIEQILYGRSGLDARSFIETAREKGVGGFLENPQCLNMLGDVVMGSGGWPESRLELFEQACLQVIREHNPEHVAATERSSSSTAIPEEVVLRAAGRLCALLLISGSSGYAVGPGREDAEYPESSRCAGEHREAAREAVSTKLFKAVAEGRYEPVHRHVAEFLAGRDLARLIEGERRNGRRVRHGVPARRIIALMTGHDGGVVTELRGLSAWIAAQGQSARNELVCRTLDDGPPANPADLAALVTDRLGEIGDRIRNGNTDDWRQYWNEDPHGRPCKPKREESCRDALLSDLRQCLPDEVDAQPEGHYADDKRADIRISCRDFQIPVETSVTTQNRPLVDG